MKKSALLFAAFIGFGYGVSEPAQAQKWADLTMTIVYDGEPPAPKEINASADPVCAAIKIYGEELVIDKETKGIANVVFMIDTKKTKLKKDQLPEALQSPSKDSAVLDNVKCQFVPHVMAIRAGQTITVKNSDNTGHNAKFNFFENEEVNPLIPKGGSKDVATKKEEKAPTKVDCNIHPWMSAFVIVTDHPYVGISDTQGKIKIEKLPADVELDFKLWHENQNKSIEEVTIGGKKETWAKGTTKLKLKEGENDLGVILIKPDRFKK